MERKEKCDFSSSSNYIHRHPQQASYTSYNTILSNRLYSLHVILCWLTVSERVADDLIQRYVLGVMSIDSSRESQSAVPRWLFARDTFILYYSFLFKLLFSELIELTWNREIFVYRFGSKTRETSNVVHETGETFTFYNKIIRRNERD